MRGANIVVWGFGRHGGGLAAARFCAQRGAHVAILDRQAAAEFGVEAVPWPWHQGDGTHPCLREADLIVASPAIPPRAWPAVHAPMTSPEALAFAEHRGPRIAVTGTKGKSTTTAIIAALTGWTAAGNGWTPIPDAIVDPATPLVCELSSFQLWYLAQERVPPRFAVGVLTLLGRDHLDWHPDLAHYHAAKRALLGWCESAVAFDQPNTVWIEDGNFRYADGLIAETATLRLAGAHNRANACLALAAALAVGVDRGLLAARLASVVALPHRLQTVHRTEHLCFIDDSIATTPEATIAALHAVDGPLAVILGGSDKGADFSMLAHTVAERRARPILIGQTAPRIAAALATCGVDAALRPNLDLAVAAAIDAIGTGTVLLSPACASFDQFRGFEDRGDRFAAAARLIAPSGAATAPG